MKHLYGQDLNHALFRILLVNRDQPVSYRRIYKMMWGGDHGDVTKYSRVTTQINRLKDLLVDHGITRWQILSNGHGQDTLSYMLVRINTDAVEDGQVQTPSPWNKTNIGRRGLREWYRSDDRMGDW